MEQGIDYSKIEDVAGELNRSAKLNDLLNEEIQDIYESTQKVINAKTSQEKQEATSLLVIQLENRLSYINALQTTISDQVINQRDILDDLVDDLIDVQITDYLDDIESEDDEDKETSDNENR